MLTFDELTPENGKVIAEVACGHEGSIDRAKQLVDIVKQTKTNLIKFQIFFVHERAKKGEKEWEIFDGLTFNESDWHEVVEYARNSGLRVLADVYGYESFELAKSLNVEGFKIHSEDLLNTYFIKEVVSCEKLTLLGVGGSKGKEIYELLDFLDREVPSMSIVLMPGIQTFPTPVDAHSVKEVQELLSSYGDRFSVKVGFADHVDGGSDLALFLPLMALAHGAVILEKHITVNRDSKWIDYQSALDEETFRGFVETVSVLSPLLKSNEKVTFSEKKYRKMFKKTISAARDVEKGEVFSPSIFKFNKNVEVAVPISALRLAGKEAVKDISVESPITLNDSIQTIGAIIVARLSSSRMPSKALRKIQGRESIRLVIDRIKKVRNVTHIILATSVDPADDVLEKIAEEESISIYRGSLENVADRYYRAAETYNLDHFLRVTGDAIICDNVMADIAIEEHIREANDVTFIENMPFGTAKEVVSLASIKTIVENAVVEENTEYLEYFLCNEKVFNVGSVTSDYEFDPKMRITLDYEEDLEFFGQVFGHFKYVKPEFSLAEAISFLNNHPEVVAINSHKTQKFLLGDVNSSMRI